MNASMQGVRGGVQLVFDAVEGITNSVENMHETIALTAMPWARQSPGEPTRARGLIAASVYAAIRGVNSALRQGADLSFDLLNKPAPATAPTSEMAAIAALNGVFGDHLEETDNPLATPMSLTTGHRSVQTNSDDLASAFPHASPHLVILVHGLSLSDQCWEAKGVPGVGSKLQQEQDCTTVYLRYNSGRHISTNGREFAATLERLCEAWPVPVKSVSLIGHSMGGLVIRSACWYAQQTESTWLQHLRKVICLGTPHHGSPLEKAGHVVDTLLQRIVYTAPLAFTRKRSAGIKDLRHGYLLDEDWQYTEQEYPNNRQLVPLLPQVDYYFAAATVGRDPDDPLGKVFGDLLVSLDSAVGDHPDDSRHLPVEVENCRIFHDTNHFDLLHNERVHRQVIDWFCED